MYLSIYLLCFFSRHFPSVTFYKAGSMVVYPGEVQDTEAVVEFLTSEDALELPDKIEATDEENLFRSGGGLKNIDSCSNPKGRRKKTTFYGHVPSYRGFTDI